MTPRQKLRALGYATSPRGIAEFQRSYASLAVSVLPVTGRLDLETLEAIDIAYRARAFLDIKKEGST